jgi:hypothetical protein
MASKNDDVTLPFSVLDAIVGDVFSVLWEPDMMAEMGSALKILTSEVLTSGVQQVLAATAMTALMSAIQWPIRESTSISLDVNEPDDSPHKTRLSYR